MITATRPPVRTKPYYQLGGNLPLDAPSYVRRAADTDLVNQLMAGRFCYVLTSRQMGKSSLMIHTAKALRDADTRVAILDLQLFGQNVTPEQWYDGLLIQLGSCFDLEGELEEFWNRKEGGIEKMGPMQKWITAVREVILRSVEERIVVFVDEIDYVRSLPFSTDEFFAGIRQMYNERSIDPALERITFCLLGVATPSDLIRNVNTTPFNIGHRIELTDFTEAEAEPLLGGLGRDEPTARKVLRRILWWTGGHPYLTQKLCATVSPDASVTSAADVDRVCEDIYLSSRALEKDDNLLFVRDSVQRSDVDHASLLDLYSQIHAQKKVLYDDTSALVDTLLLAGLVSVDQGRLRVRNRIYAHVFDKQWIRRNMPDAELRRQRRAFLQGLTIAAMLAAIVLAVVGGLAWTDYKTNKTLNKETATRKIQSYSSNMVQAQQEFDAGDYTTGGNLLQRWMKDVPAWAGFEWNWLWGRYNGDSATTYKGDWDEVRTVDVSPSLGSGLIATGSADSTVRIFDRNVSCTPDSAVGGGGIPLPTDSASSLPCVTLKYVFKVGNSGLDRVSPDDLKKVEADQKASNNPVRGISWVTFSPDGGWIGVSTGIWHSSEIDGKVYLIRAADGAVFPVPTHQRGAINAIALGPKGELVTAGNDKTAEFFHIQPDGTVTASAPAYDPKDQVGGIMNAVAISPDGRYAAMAYDDGRLAVKDMQKPAEEPQLKLVDVSGVVSVAFYNDNNILMGSKDGHIWRVDRPTRKAAILAEGGQGLISDIRVSTAPGAKEPNLMVTTGTTVRVWRLLHHDEIEAWEPVTLLGHQGKVYQSDISPDQGLIVSVGADHTVRFWKKQLPVTFGELARTNDSVNRTPNFASEADSIGIQGVARALAFSPAEDHQMVFLRGVPEDGTVTDQSCAGTGTRVFFYDLAQRSLLLGPDGKPGICAHRGFGTAVAYSANGSYVATGGNHGSVLLWNAHKPAEHLELPQPLGDFPVTGLAFARDGTLMASMGSSTRSSLVVWRPNPHAASVQDAYLPAEIKPSKDKVLGALAFSSNGQFLAVCTTGRTNTVEVWKTARILDAKFGFDATPDHLGPAKSDVNRLDGPCTSVAFSPDANSHWLAAGALARNIAVWDVSNDWQRVPDPSPATSYVNAVTFTRDSNTVAYATTDSKVFLWNLAENQPLPTVDFHAGGIWSIAFSPNGNCLASGSTDGSLRITPTADPMLVNKDWIPFGSFWKSCTKEK